MKNIPVYILIAFMTLLGGGSTIYVVVSMPIVIISKIYRKIKLGEKIL